MMLDIEYTQIILYVENQDISTDFYCKILDKNPEINVPGMTEFMLSKNTRLGLMPNSGIAKIITPGLPHPSQRNGIPGCELYLLCKSILPYLERATIAGANCISELSTRDWGHKVAYFSDPDGHVIAFAEKTKIRD